MRPLRFVVPSLSLAFVACTGGEVIEDTTSITGRIFDVQTMATLDLAKVTSMPPLKTAMTGVDGEFVIDSARYATLYQLRIERDGYETRTVNITPSVQADNRLEIGLTVLAVCTAGQTRCVQGGGIEGFETCATRGNAWMLTECPANQACDPSTVLCAGAQTLTAREPQNGVIRSQPAGINCGMSCTRDFITGTAVTLTATPLGLGTFTGWTDDCASAGTEPTCMVTMDAPHTVGASFQAFSINVQRQGDGNGTVVSAPAGIDCGDTCTATFDENEVVTLTATPVAPSVFAGWGGDCAGMTPTCMVTVDGAKDVRARFNVPRFTLDVARIGTGAGSITSMPAGIDCGAECSFDYEIDTMVTLTAMPANGSTFEGWMGACTDLTPTCVVTMDQARSVTAVFDGVAYPLDVTLGGTGAGTVTSVPGGINCGATCTATYGPATMITLTAAPNASSNFGGWGGDCAPAGTALTCDLTINAATSVTAGFDLVAVDFTTVVNGDGQVTSAPPGINCPGDCTEPFNPGTMVTLTAAPNAGSALAAWAGGCAAAGNNPTCMLTVAAGINATANFEFLYALPLAVDANCTALYRFNGAAPFASSCGGVGPAVIAGTYASIASRNAYLIDALDAGGADEEGSIDTTASTPIAPATIELSVRKDGPAFNARTAGVLYSDLDATDPARTGVRIVVYDNGRLVVETRAGPGMTSTASTAAGVIGDGTWYHVAATISDTTGIAVFVDGTESIRVAGQPLLTQSSSTAWVGAEREGAGAIYRFNGAVDEVRVSNIVRY